MDSLPTGAIQSWFNMPAATLGPVIMLLVGFVGTDRWLGRQLSEKRGLTPSESSKARKRRLGEVPGHLARLPHPRPPVKLPLTTDALRRRFCSISRFIAKCMVDGLDLFRLPPRA